MTQAGKAGCNMEVSDKLNLITQRVMADAAAKRDELKKKAKKEIDDALKRKELDALQEAYDTIQGELSSLRAQNSGKIAQANEEARKALLKKRDDITEQVFLGVREKIEAFRASDGYGPWLVKQAETALGCAGESACTISVLPGDESLVAQLGRENVTVKTDLKNAIGGCQVFCPDKNILIDLTLQTKLEEAKANFHALHI